MKTKPKRQKKRYEGKKMLLRYSFSSYYSSFAFAICLFACGNFLSRFCFVSCKKKEKKKKIAKEEAVAK